MKVPDLLALTRRLLETKYRCLEWFHTDREILVALLSLAVDPATRNREPEELAELCAQALGDDLTRQTVHHA